MEKRFYLIIILVGIFIVKGLTQERIISGIVKDRHNMEGLPGAEVFLPGTGIGTVTDNSGYFKLRLPLNSGTRLVAILLGYTPDTMSLNIRQSFYQFTLLPVSGSLNEVVVSGTLKEVSKSQSPIPVEVYSPSFFRKNPSPGIFESLSMVNGVQPQLNCNVCNTGDIHINGMEGPYTMVLIDGMPIVSSLSTVYGLAGIPNSMVKRIEIVKGPASTLYGSEAVGGIINIITRDASSASKLKTDYSITSLGEHNADISTRLRLHHKSSLLGINAFWFDRIHDINADHFTDITLQKRVSVFNKWNFEKRPAFASSLAIRYVYEDRWGGETNWDKSFRGTDNVYGESIYTHRIELIGSHKLPVMKEDLTLQYSYNYHFQDSYYGTAKYLAAQHTTFAQLLWSKTKNKHHFLTGVPFRFIWYDDNTPATAGNDSLHPSNLPQRTYLPGVFMQDEWMLSGKWMALAGLRYDHNSAHGNIITPRLSFKYAPDKINAFRLSMGNGYRVVNIFTEDHAALTGAREVEIREALKPEKSWNANLNYTTQLNYRYGFIGLDASLFYTYFTNKITGDFMTDPHKIIYDNLAGFAVSKGFTLNTDFAFTNGFKVISGLTLMDVYQVDHEKKIPQQFAPRFSGTFAVSYAWSKPGISIDWTGRVNGPMYLPVVPNDFRPEKSPWYCLMNIQGSKKINRMKQQFEIYSGIKNLLNFIPANPILRPFDPFNKNIKVDNPEGYTFDPGYNYAPVQGIKFFAGLRWTLE
jgi:outer membrane receptor for ferrienterochelin and colicins